MGMKFTCQEIADLKELLSSIVYGGFATLDNIEKEFPGTRDKFFEYREKEFSNDLCALKDFAMIKNNDMAIVYAKTMDRIVVAERIFFKINQAEFE